MIFLSLLSLGYAKDLDNRIGVGLDNWLNETPSISIRYGIPMPKEIFEVQVEGLLGINTHPSNPDNLLIGARGLYALVVEDSVNVYGAAAIAGLIVDGTSAVRLQPGLEVQYFPLGTGNASISAGIGLNLDLGVGNTRTYIHGSALGGFHYWF